MGRMLNIYDLINCSFANGPGRRTVIWTQGCSLRCKGCFNESLQSFDIYKLVDTQYLANKAAEQNDEGLTISGGEPLDQAEAVKDLVDEYRSLCGKSVMLFSGYTYSEIKADMQKLETLLSVDAALCGRYIKGDIWSSKELVLVTGKIKADDVKAISQVEIVISGDKAKVTGYPKMN